jgi:hypothetical protein
MKLQVNVFEYFDSRQLIVCGNHFRRIREVELKRDYAFIVCVLYCPQFNSATVTYIMVACSYYRN